MKMTEEDHGQYYVVKRKALPEVLLKVVEVKRLLESDSSMTIQKASEKVDLSRSSFYKYKDDIFPFHDNVRGKTITFLIMMSDIPGILSSVLQNVSSYGANVLTIHQTIPINGVATLTLSVEIPAESGNTSDMLEHMEAIPGVQELRILGRE